MLGAFVVFLDQLLELSVTGDTAKYLVLKLCKGCALSPLDSSNPNYPLHPICAKEKEKIEMRLFRSMFSYPNQLDPFPTIHLHLLVKPGGSHTT